MSMYRISLPFPYPQKKLYCSFAVISLRISWDIQRVQGPESVLAVQLAGAVAVGLRDGAGVAQRPAQALALRKSFQGAVREELPAHSDAVQSVQSAHGAARR